MERKRRTGRGSFAFLANASGGNGRVSSGIRLIQKENQCLKFTLESRDCHAFNTNCRRIDSITEYKIVRRCKMKEHIS